MNLISIQFSIQRVIPDALSRSSAYRGKVFQTSHLCLIHIWAWYLLMWKCTWPVCRLHQYDSHSHHDPLNDASQSDFSSFRINLIGRLDQSIILNVSDWNSRFICDTKTQTKPDLIIQMIHKSLSNCWGIRIRKSTIQWSTLCIIQTKWPWLSSLWRNRGRFQPKLMFLCDYSSQESLMNTTQSVLSLSQIKKKNQLKSPSCIHIIKQSSLPFKSYFMFLKVKKSAKIVFYVNEREKNESVFNVNIFPM